MSSWYGKATVKELDSLIEKKPKLAELMLFPDFVTELKAYNTKLLEYLTNNSQLIGELVDFIAVPPSPNDSDDRKFKLPLVAIEVIESETTCIHHGLFKEQQGEQTYFESLFKILDSQEVLPILAGYLLRANICLLSNRQKQTIDRVYSMPRFFSKLIEHSYHLSITNIIQLFLNLDTNKHQNHAQNENRVKVKLQALQQIISKIQIESGLRNEKSTMIIENLCGILYETMEKYFLIINGKQMMEIITSEKTVAIFMTMIKSPYFSDNAFPAFNFFTSLIHYYSFSSFNVDDLSSEDGKRNLERLQSQPMVVQLTNYFSTALDRIMRSPVMNLYLYRLLEVLCHCISISSMKIFECTRKTQFFNNLLKLMFTHERHNILHVLVEKSFLHVFISDRKIYQLYKKHLFCEIDIIDSTAGHFVRQFPLEKLLEEGRKKAYFGHFMRILKIYSGIQTQDKAIIQAIKSKSELWNKISKNLIIPFETIYEKKLGSYDQVPEPTYQQFKVDKNIKIKTNPMKNSTIEQINKEQNIPAVLKTEIQTDAYTKMQELEEKKAQEIFYRTPIQGFLAQNQIIASSSSTATASTPVVTAASAQAGTQKPPLPVRQNYHMSKSNVIDSLPNQKEMKKSESFKQFMDKKKVQAQQEIKMKRSLSHEKRLSGNKSKINSPSPSKVNNWKQQTDQSSSQKLDTSIKSALPQSQSQIPKIPLSRKPVTGTITSDRGYPHNPSPGQQNPSNYSIQPQQNSLNSLKLNPSLHNSNLNSSGVAMSASNVSLSREEIVDGAPNGDALAQIKKIRVFQIDKPAEKKYRRVEKRDQVLFNFLGLPI